MILCSLLKLIASLLASGEIDLSIESRFASTMDSALERVGQFVEGETNHRRSSISGSGIALTILAEAAGLSLDGYIETPGENPTVHASAT